MLATCLFASCPLVSLLEMECEVPFSCVAFLWRFLCVLCVVGVLLLCKKNSKADTLTWAQAPERFLFVFTSSLVDRLFKSLNKVFSKGGWLLDALGGNREGTYCRERGRLTCGSLQVLL
jgi:hypothetical protein